jgi:hypothetical protein
MSPDLTCEHCGDPVEAFEITAFGDKEKRFVAGLCPCPRPHCPLCRSLLDANGRCTDRQADCCLWQLVVPLPEVW